MREQQKKGDKRNRILIQLGIVTSVLVASGAIAFAVFSASNQSQAVPVNAIFNDGVKVGSGLQVYTPESSPPLIQPNPVEIVVYVDYQCPVCAVFELPNSEQLKDWVASGVATLELHPLSFLDGRGTPNAFSSRAANASLCVADNSPDSFFDYNTRLFQSQPTEGAPGPENSELIAFAQEVGVTNLDQVSSCINSKMFGSFIKDATDRALSEPIPGTNLRVEGTPAIFVNGEQYGWSTMDELASPARFAQFIQTITAEATE
jgi:protein-disulfide isomerase